MHNDMDKKPPAKQFLAITFLCENQPGILHTLAKTVTYQGCNIEASRMTALGMTANIAMLVSGTWDAIAKLETHLPSLEKRYAAKMLLRRTISQSEKISKESLISYSIELVTPENQGIISALSGFFSEQNIDIHEVYSSSFINHLGTRLSSLGMRVYIPTNLQISDLRERFMILCDDLNIDAILEPDRN